MKMRRTQTVAVMLCAIVAVAAVAAAATPEDLEALVRRLEQRIANQDQRIAQLHEKVSDDNLREARQDEIRKILKEMNAEMGQGGAMPAWAQDLKFFGDFRLRYHGDGFDAADRKDRSRARFRLRFGFKKWFLNKQMEVGFRLASGHQDSDYDGEGAPTSANQSFDTGFSQKNLWIDWAYARYTPDWLKGFTVVGGKFPIPWVKTDVIWDSDVTPEGFYGSYTRKIPGTEVTATGGVGYMVVEEAAAGHGSGLHVYQVSATSPIPGGLKYLVALTYYDYDHIENNFREADGNHLVGGVLQAQEFETIDLI
ncbi:hypothetical protein LCGC14_2166060, partial [marine sediment metagenome]